MNTFISDFISTKLEHHDFSSNKKVIITSAEKNQFDQALDKLGMATTDVKDSYKDLKTTLDGLPTGMGFGASLYELATKDVYEDLYNGASGLNLDYAQKRTEILAQLIQVMEIAKQTGNPRIVEHFLKRTKAAAKNSGMTVDDSLHWRELEAAAKFATKEDSVATRLINSNPKLCFLDVESLGAETCVFDAALEELKTRHAHISQIKPDGNSNWNKAESEPTAAFAAGVNDMGALKTFGQVTTAYTLWSYKGAIASALTAAKAAMKFPGWGKIIGGVLAGGAILAKVIGDVQNGEDWTKSAKEYLPDSWGSVVKGIRDFIIPDIGKLCGGSLWSWCDSSDQQALRAGVAV